MYADLDDLEPPQLEAAPQAGLVDPTAAQAATGLHPDIKTILRDKIDDDGIRHIAEAMMPAVIAVSSWTFQTMMESHMFPVTANGTTTVTTLEVHLADAKRGAGPAQPAPDLAAAVAAATASAVSGALQQQSTRAPTEAAQRQTTYNIVHTSAKKVTTTGKVTNLGLGPDQERHNARRGLLADILQNILNGAKMSNFHAGDLARYRALGSRFHPLRAKIIGSLDAVSMAATTREIMKMINQLRSADLEPVLWTQRPGMPAMQALCEALAMAYCMNSHFPIRLFLYATHSTLMEEAASEFSTGNTLETLMKSRCDWSPIALDDTVDGSKEWTAEPRTTDEPPQKLHRTEGRQFDSNHKPPERNLEQLRADMAAEINKVISEGNWCRKPFATPPADGKLPPASEAGFTLGVKHLFPFGGKYFTDNYPAKFKRELACLICGTIGHKAALCTNYGSIAIGEPWWKLVEQAANAEGLKVIIPAERENIKATTPVTFATDYAPRPRVKH